jgi:hypothetical protein
MARYLIQSGHTPEECLATLDAALAQGREMLAQYDFACAAGDHTNHTCYVTLEAPSEKAARELVAGPVAARAEVVEVGKFTEAQIRSFHGS